MKKFINTVDTMLAQSLDGFAAAHADIVALGPERKFVRRRSPNANKVALISGGGSGHEPLHAGLVGLGMLDAACPGQIFTSPTPDQIVEAATAVGGKAGVLFIVKNYAGDCMNFEMAAEVFEGPSRDRGHQRRCRGREIDLQRRASRRRRYAGRREDRRRGRREGHGPEILRRARRPR